MGINFQGTLTDREVIAVTGSKNVNGHAVYAAIDLRAEQSILATDARLSAPVDLAIGDLDCMFRHLPMDYSLGPSHRKPMLYNTGQEIVLALLGLVDAQLFSQRTGLLYKQAPAPLSVCLTLDSRTIATDHIRNTVAKARAKPDGPRLSGTDRLFIADDRILVNDRAYPISMEILLNTGGVARRTFNIYLADALVRLAAGYADRFMLTVTTSQGVVSTDPAINSALQRHGQPGPCCSVLDGSAVRYTEGDLKLRQMMLFLLASAVLPPTARILLFFNADADTLLTAEIQPLYPHITVLWARSHQPKGPYRCLSVTQIRSTLAVKQARFLAADRKAAALAPDAGNYDLMATFYFFIHFLYGGDYLSYEVSWPSRSPALELLTRGIFLSCIRVDPAAESVTLQLAGLHFFLQQWLGEKALAVPAKQPRLETVYRAMADRLARVARVLLYYAGVESAGWDQPAPPFPPEIRELGRHTMHYYLDPKATWVIGSAAPAASAGRPMIGICASWEVDPPLVEITTTENALNRLKEMQPVLQEGVCVAYQPPTLPAGEQITAALVHRIDNLLDMIEHGTYITHPSAIAIIEIYSDKILVSAEQRPISAPMVISSSSEVSADEDDSQATVVDEPVFCSPPAVATAADTPFRAMFTKPLTAGIDCEWDSDKEDPLRYPDPPLPDRRRKRRIPQTREQSQSPPIDWAAIRARPRQPKRRCMPHSDPVPGVLRAAEPDDDNEENDEVDQFDDDRQVMGRARPTLVPNEDGFL